MRLTILCVGIIGLLVVLPSTVLSQVMLEHAITAAGGSAAGVAGKGVSNGIDTIFRKLDQQSNKAAEAALVKRLKPRTSEAETEAASPIEAGVITTARIPIAGSTPPPEAAGAGERAVPEPVTWWPVPAQPLRPEPTVADLGTIEAGNSRQEVVARLGAPAARVIIPDQGLREVYLFNSHGTHLGKVTLTNGEVESVRVAATQ